MAQAAALTTADRRHRAAIGLALAVAIAAAVRIATARYSLWFDEYASLFFASQPLSRLWSGWMLRETNPPLFYSALRGWIAIAGIDEVRLRLLPILASLAAIVVVHAGVGRAYGARAAAVAALLLALSPQQLYFAQQLRAYMPLYLAVAISFFGLVRIAEPGEGARAGGWIAYVGGAVAGIYLHTTAIVWPAAATLALMLVDRRYRPIAGAAWLRLFAAGLVILAGAGWWLWITVLQLRAPAGNIGWMQDMAGGKTAVIYVANALLSRQIAPWQAAAPLIVAGLAAFGAWRTRDLAPTRLAIACFAMATLVFLVLQLRQPVMLDRTLFWLSLFPLTMVAAGAASIRGRVPFMAAAGALLVTQAINLAVLAPHLVKEDWRPMILAVARDRHATLLVDGEAMNVAAAMACAVELGRAGCPFPVVSLAGAAPPIDTWGAGFATPAPATPAGRLRLPDDTDVYLFRRAFHDVLDDVHGAALLPEMRSGALPRPLLVGPLPPSFAAALARRSHVVAGVVRVDQGPAGTGTPRT